MAKKKARTRTSSLAATPSSSRNTPSEPQALREALEGGRSGFDLHAADVEDALLRNDPALRPQLEELFGAELTRELAALVPRAERAAQRSATRALILPGIMGSTLGFEGALLDDTIWLDPTDVARGNLLLLAPDRSTKRPVKALGALLHVYLKLKLCLRLKGIAAAFFPYDWRLDIRSEGQRLAAHIEAEAGGRPIALVAHSMGGLIARRALRVLSDRGQADLVSRIVMLGTPNFGSFAPIQVMRMQHSVAAMLARIDITNSAEELVDGLYSKLVGLAQLLPAAERAGGLDLLRSETWPGKLKPTSGALSKARQLADDLAIDPSKMVLIAGIDRPTLVGARVVGNEFELQESRAGDGVVPLEFARLPEVRTYYTRAEHGGMPNNGAVIDAVADLVIRPTTAALPDEPFEYSSEARPVRAVELAARAQPFGGRRGTEVTPSEVRELLSPFAAPTRPTASGAASDATEASAQDWRELSTEPVQVSRKRQRALEICLAHGDISQVDARAIVLGLFQGVEPSGAADALDRHLEGSIRQLVENDLLRGEVGQIFVLPTGRRRMRAEFVVFVGLGPVDSFDDSVRRRVARNVALAMSEARLDDFATVLLGGNSGSDAGAAMASMASGFFDAFQGELDQELVRRIVICEHDQQRFEHAVENVRTLLTSSVFDEVYVTFSTKELPPPVMAPVGWRHGAPSRVEPIYLMARELIDPGAGPHSTILDLSLLTAEGGATVLSGQTTVKFEALDRLLHRLANSQSETALDELGKWLADTALPREVRRGLEANVATRHMVVVHDTAAARIPWEALKLGKVRPALQCGISRKYSTSLTASGWLKVRSASERLRVLLVVDPTEDLAGAREEGKAVREALRASGVVELLELTGREATRLRLQSELRSSRYDVLHYAGHAFFDPDRRERSGLLCHGSEVFTSTDLVGVPMLPALAVVNACESARVRRAPNGSVSIEIDKALAQTRASRNADSLERSAVKHSLAEAFLRGGIAGYVGTYWPVGDAAALDFARTFYRELLEGKPVAEALVDARNSIAASSIDWADYIHYGTRTLRLRAPGSTK